MLRALAIFAAIAAGLAPAYGQARVGIAVVVGDEDPSVALEALAKEGASLRTLGKADVDSLTPPRNVSDDERQRIVDSAESSYAHWVSGDIEAARFEARAVRTTLLSRTWDEQGFQVLRRALYRSLVVEALALSRRGDSRESYALMNELKNFFGATFEKKRYGPEATDLFEKALAHKRLANAQIRVSVPAGARLYLNHEVAAASYGRRRTVILKVPVGTHWLYTRGSLVGHTGFRLVPVQVSKPASFDVRLAPDLHGNLRWEKDSALLSYSDAVAARNLATDAEAIRSFLGANEITVAYLSSGNPAKRTLAASDWKTNGAFRVAGPAPPKARTVLGGMALASAAATAIGGAVLWSMDGSGTCSGPVECPNLYRTKLGASALFASSAVLLGTGLYFLLGNRAGTEVAPIALTPRAGGGSVGISGNF